MIRRYIPPLLLLAVLLLIWEWVAGRPGVSDVTLASPTEVAQSLADNSGLLLDNAWVTLWEVLLGLGLALLLGGGAAIAMHLVRPLREAAYPLLVASQAIPTVVLAPLFVLAFDFGLAPKLAIVALICFFPITVNLMDGLRSVDPELLRLMKSFGASRPAVLRKVELPSSLPYLFSGLRVAATVSVIGAVFGEWAGAEEGLGWLVLNDNSHLETARVYAGVVVLSVMAIALFVAVTLLERRLVPWRRTEA